MATNNDTVNAKTANFFLSFARELAEKQFDVELIGVKKGEALLKRRVFNKGEAMSGQKIGKYSTTPGYFSPKSFIKKGGFKGIGKPFGVFEEDEFVFSAGKKFHKKKKYGKKRRHTSMYLEKGYKQLREINGRQTNFVDLQYSGSLFQSIQTATSARHPVLKILGRKEAEVSEGLEEKYGKDIFSLSAAERLEVKRDMGTAVSKYLKEFLKKNK